MFTAGFKQSPFFRTLSLAVVFCFAATILPSQTVFAQSFYLPPPGAMISPSAAYMPVTMKGMVVHPENPLLFDFIIDSGKSGLKLDSPAFKTESQKLIKYFLAALTIKEEDLWVNLSPYEKNRIMPEALSKTDMGRDMLAQDYLLKQLTASMLYPEKELGKKFWDRVYAKIQKKYGTVDIPVDTFNKVWIVADSAKVVQRNNAAYVVGWRLKVMLEEDYLALDKNSAILGRAPTRGAPTPSGDDKVGNTVVGAVVGAPLVGARHRDVAAHTLASQAVKEIIIPEIEKEVNQGKHFSQLRQMFYSMILASWYKSALKDALLNKVYTNQSKISGVKTADPAIKEKIYEQYLKAFKQGVFNYIKENTDPITEETTLRQYFSGGVVANFSSPAIVSPANISQLDGPAALVPVAASPVRPLSGQTDAEPVNLVIQNFFVHPVSDNTKMYALSRYTNQLMNEKVAAMLGVKVGVKTHEIYCLVKDAQAGRAEDIIAFLFVPRNSPDILFVFTSDSAREQYSTSLDQGIIDELKRQDIFLIYGRKIAEGKSEHNLIFPQGVTAVKSEGGAIVLRDRRNLSEIAALVVDWINKIPAGEIAKANKSKTTTLDNKWSQNSLYSLSDARIAEQNTRTVLRLLQMAGETDAELRQMIRDEIGESGKAALGLWKGVRKVWYKRYPRVSSKPNPAGEPAKELWNLLYPKTAAAASPVELNVGLRPMIHSLDGGRELIAVEVDEAERRDLAAILGMKPADFEPRLYIVTDSLEQFLYFVIYKMSPDQKQAKATIVYPEEQTAASRALRNVLKQIISGTQPDLVFADSIPVPKGVVIAYDAIDHTITLTRPTAASPAQASRAAVAEQVLDFLNQVPTVEDAAVNKGGTENFQGKILNKNLYSEVDAIKAAKNIMAALRVLQAAGEADPELIKMIRKDIGETARQALNLWSIKRKVWYKAPHGIFSKNNPAKRPAFELWKMLYPEPDEAATAAALPKQEPIDVSDSAQLLNPREKKAVQEIRWHLGKYGIGPEDFIGQDIILHNGERTLRLSYNPAVREEIFDSEREMADMLTSFGFKIKIVESSDLAHFISI
ncbi:MAG: hypothetical protein HQL23_09330, partial [Candidatus Omnitrophica bacterium]|nr:hypothetical protein [Candidatus Omnitrophota bacterium]